jgi:LptD protein
MARAPLLAAAVLMSGLAASAVQAPLVAQQPAPQEAPTDSVRVEALERLKRLARPPGADSALYLEDSLRAATTTAPNRPEAAAGMDSVAQALVAMPGYAVTDYSGGSADFEAQDHVLVLHAAEGARARVVRGVAGGAVALEADSSITYDQATGRVHMVGHPTAQSPEGETVESAQMVYDLNQERGTALDAKTSYTQAGARWLVRGDMPYAAQDSSFMSDAQFTSCDLEVPHYHFETDRIKVVAGNILVATGVRLYFADVPVFWLPFIAQSLSSGRHSGILTPRFSVNDIVRTSVGYRRRVSNIGFYWAMSDYSDALIAADWFSNTFFSLTASSQYKINSRFLSGDVNLREYWQPDGSKQLAFDTQHSWKLDERTDLRASARYAHNDFVKQNSFNPREVTQSIDSQGGVNRRFDWGATAPSGPCRRPTFRSRRSRCCEPRSRTRASGTT